jgi:hypothetical protein
MARAAVGLNFWRRHMQAPIKISKTRPENCEFPARGRYTSGRLSMKDSVGQARACAE